MLKTVTKKKTHEKVKQKYLSLSKENDDVQEQELNETGNATNELEEAIILIHQYEDIIRTQKKKSIGFIGKCGQLSKKFKDTEQFFEKFGQGKSTIFFKISLYKFLKKHPKLKKSRLRSGCS